MGDGLAVGTKERILAAAIELFRAHGLHGVSVRGIAVAAETDPALVIRHFGSKELLFLEAMRIPDDSADLFAGPIEGIGRRCIGVLLDFSAETRATFLALLRGSSGAAVGEQLSRAHLELFVAPLEARLTGPDTDLRARLAASLVGGLLYSLWIVGDEVLLTTDRPRLVERYGALLQQLVTPAP